MKFGARIEAEAARSGQPHKYFAYNTIKQHIKSKDISAVQKNLHLEMEKVEHHFRQEEFDCMRTFNELQKQSWNCAAVRESAIASLERRINQLVGFGQWNYTAVEKITKKIRRRLGQGILPDTTSTMLEQWYPYVSMEPARMLAMLQDLPARPDTGTSSRSDDNDISSAADCHGDDGDSTCNGDGAHDGERDEDADPAAAAAAGRVVGVHNGGGLDGSAMDSHGEGDDARESGIDEEEDLEHEDTAHSAAHAADTPATVATVRRRRVNRNDSTKQCDDDNRIRSPALTRGAAKPSGTTHTGGSNTTAAANATSGATATPAIHSTPASTAQATRTDEASGGEESDAEVSATGCPVCLCTRMREPALCSCAHTFCFDCISQTETCPVCRKRHFSTFVIAGSGDVVTVDSAWQSGDESPSVMAAALRRVRDIIWYLVVLVVLLPFLAALFALGFMWSGARELIDAIRGKQTVYPVPLSYKKLPLIAPHGLTTAPPPWSQPTLWE
ncbi:hypothetical protein PTSG_02012 [Salpingoeca rosetta]|uniref:RING-type domain-containing protein n=1 Tax=Salpingoeca rosetta (strain ATCC 50818 / BSB-021) TaxID=946362 RepID=F2TZM0_SALR5|nr:uncharacterized protein PTSG_02012 [Salpingoeca rosetta]EGD79044.1 hypothetical protein PTSG_02012 [Salpingoeca rosetta]|eukprot:XP_004998000.1 hypothetical protein PTSG_02012 [Salpingoeca rosetta]